MGNSCLNTSDSSVENRRNKRINYESTNNHRIKINSKMNIEEEVWQNDKLSFLSNPITRPAGFVSETTNHNADQPPQSLATASKLAGKQPQEETEKKRSLKNIEENEKDEELLTEKNMDIKVEFGNMDDNISVQSHLKEEFEGNNNEDFRQIEARDSLSFQPCKFLNQDTHMSSSEVPMSFGIGVLDKAKSRSDLDDEE